MKELLDDEIEIIEDGKSTVKKILFTSEYKNQNLVFFLDDEDSEEVICAVYDDKGNLYEPDEETMLWAQKTLESWQKDEGSDVD